MGQEASLPLDHDFDEQAKAPPSAANPSSTSTKTIPGSLPNLQRAFNAAASAAVASRPLSAKGVFQNNSEYAYDARDAAQAVGTEQTLNSPLDDPRYQSSHFVEENVLLSQGSRFAPGVAHESSVRDDRSPNSPLRGPPESEGDSNHPVSVGILPERTGSKRGLFSTPGRSLAHSRGAALIHSMRSITLGKALGGGKAGNQSSKQQLDWEKQWDEDDDSEDEIGEDLPFESVAALDVKRSGSTEPLEGVRLSSTTASGQPSLEAQQLAPPSAFVNESAIAPRNDEFFTDPSYECATDDAKPNVEMFLPMLRVLGKGSFGKVVLVQKRVGKERGQLFAMKILRKTHLVKRRQIERTRTERKVLSSVNHPFIMKLHYAFQTEDKLYLVLDYCPGGELFFHLSRCRRFPERVARFYAAELLLAIGHLHKRGIIYRDLKPENVLLDAEGHVKLGDFGLAKAGITNPFDGASSICGTPEYLAPEVLSQQGHGFCVDYWGLGMLTYEMMTGLPPWYTTDRQKLFRRLKSAPLDIPNYFSPAAADCISALLERNPRRRLGMAGIRSAMEHEFFRNISWRSLYARRVEAPVKPCESWKPPETNGFDGPDLMTKTSTLDTFVGMADPNELDAATSNFDSTFLRMPVESEDNPGEDAEDAAAAEELQHDTFLGFTFDSKELDRGDSSSPPHLQRLRTHHYHNS